MTNNQELLDNLYNAFDPDKPLQPGDPVYVDCEEVRGDGDIRKDLGNSIRRSNRMTCQLYGGHRGAGKSTELLRLKKFLEENKIKVIYFAADEEDIHPEDAQYVDILLACTRHLLEDLKETANPSPLLEWLKSRWQELKDLAVTEIKFESLNVEGQIALFAKITGNLKRVPDLRYQIREKVNPHTVTLIEALNQFINEAKKHLPSGYEQLAVIADNLDRIVPIFHENGRNNHEEIFLDRNEQLKALDCHLVYTVPISLLYSSRAADLRDIYSDPQVLPMIMLHTPEGQIYEPGYLKIKEVIEKRVRQFAPTRCLETEIFDSAKTLEALCLMSGGHVRNLLLLMKSAIEQTSDLPISKKAVQRAITKARDTYRRTVEDDQWMLLAEVAKSKQIRNDHKYRKLLFNRCLLEYKYFDSEDELHRWSDIHPLIKGIEEFQNACKKLPS
ncbi:AAA family ATPase [Microcoleus sp. FACHB-672]|uniref:AAA family ATPase n=1 Tax=Microcoleus sp. FACHB-672 TaxID=2692825 RepID=UPI001684A302|nr:AAA family ATPase [Microcoleus sp. FACHB-672]MBD2042619.1 ATP-binding protein [Microcoleus sp. FACHB-672]